VLPDSRVLGVKDDRLGDPSWRIRSTDGTAWRATRITDGDDVDVDAVPSATTVLPGGEVLVSR
jgi:hypothetical protein